MYNEAGGIVREYRFEDLNKDDRGLYNIEYLVTDSSVARIGLLDYNERTYIINPGSSGMEYVCHHYCCIFLCPVLLFVEQ